MLNEAALCITTKWVARLPKWVIRVDFGMRGNARLGGNLGNAGCSVLAGAC